MTKDSKNILIALGIAAVFWGIMFALAQFTQNRLFILLGGTLPYGLIQFLTYFLFVWGILEIKSKEKLINRENESFKINFLPESRQYLIDAQQVDVIRQNILQYESHTKYILTDLIRKACNKYLTSFSVGEMMGIVSRQSEMNYANAETEQSVIRYIVHAIPSVGFIGTVLGISKAIGEAASVTTGDIQPVTDLLHVAFDTTLIALILGLILTFFFTKLQKKEAHFHNKTEEYVVENLINRISTN